MKKLILTLTLILVAVSAFANEVRYFTRPQAVRVAKTLDAQSELMIYCGYEYELATYVIINEVWAEPVNSKYYEIWLYGYDAYTGEEIYMPIDLSCIWLYNNYGNRIYSAAQYLRFRSTVATPNFYWTMPPYNPFVRHYHDPHYNHMYTYHYEVHRFGWRPPAYAHGIHPPLHPYYMRTPSTPAMVPSHPFTPGVNYPQTPDGHGYIGGNSRNNYNTRSTAFNNAGGARNGDNRNNGGNPGTTNRNTVNNGNTGTRNNSGTTTTGRGNNTNTGTSTRGGNTGTNTTTPTTRGTNTNTGTSTRGTNTGTTTTTPTTRGTNTNTGTNTRSSNNNTTTNGRGTNTNSGTSTRGNNTGTSTSNGRGTNTNSGTSTRGSNSGTTNGNRNNSTTHTGSTSNR